MKEELSGLDLDEIQGPTERKADYICLRGLLVIEMKTLEEDGAKRMGNLVEKFRTRDDWPVFLGSAPIQSFIKNTKEPEHLTQLTLERLGRGVSTHLKKANRQLEAHCTNFVRNRVVRVMLLINEDHEIYDPSFVSHLLTHLLSRTENGRSLYAHVDAVIFVTERHATVIAGRMLFPTIVVSRYDAGEAPWKGDVINLFVKRWAQWNTADFIDLNLRPEHFSTIDHIPDSAPRHERWRTDYRRYPYFRSLSLDALRDAFDEINVQILLSFIKDSPKKPLPAETMRHMESFTHIMMEMAERGVPMPAFRYIQEREVAAARRLGFTDDMMTWLLSIRSKNEG